MVLLHGLAVSHRHLMPLAAGLARHHPVHVIDLPGFGLSDDPGTVLDVPEHAEHLAAWLAAAGAPSAVVVGNSFGCQVAVELAVRHPDRVAGTLANYGAAGHLTDLVLGFVRRRITARPDPPG
jgi:pimeloyl-ACP methyl ester carboxylesterase